MKISYKKALLVIDVQNDFCPGGELGIKGADLIIPKINKYVTLFLKENLPIFFTRDWHPKITKHFKKFGGAWPLHCIQGTKGAKFHPKLKIPKRAIILSKGSDSSQDSYSAFGATDSTGTDLLSLLKIFGVKELYIGGLATDYCVRFSGIDAIKEGLKVNVLTDAIKGVDLKKSDSKEALEELKLRGARFMTLDKIKL